MKGIEFWVINKAAIPVFIFRIGRFKIDPMVVGSFLAVISNFVKDIGEGSLKKIIIEDGIYYFIECIGFLFILRAEKEHPLFFRLLQMWMHVFFTNMSPELLLKIHDSHLQVDESKYKIIEDQIEHLYFSLIEELAEHWVHAFNYLPIHLSAASIKELVELTDKMIATYPRKTIYYYHEILKRPYLQHPQALFMAGVAFGHEIKRHLFQDVKIVQEKDVYQILDPITVSSFDKKEMSIVIKMCPFCRGIRSSTPICEFVKGVYVGALENPNFIVEETRCMATGESSCKFVLKPSKDIGKIF